MFAFFRQRRLNRYTKGASAYLEENYKPRVRTDTEGGRGSVDVSVYLNEDGAFSAENRYSFSLRDEPKKEDPYDAAEVTRLLRGGLREGNPEEMLRSLDKKVNLSFVDCLLQHISNKGMRDPEVYMAARVDKRLFSKMVSNRQYKPSKDTAVALALALELTLDEASDLLSRAGYTFSHSNKRDIIIEYFFREGVYDLLDVNEVLYRLDQELIGRTEKVV